MASAGELGVDVEHLSRAGEGDRHLLCEAPGTDRRLVGRAPTEGWSRQKVPVPFSLDLARRFFAASEIAFLEQAPPERQPGLFLEFWTLKEAYIKARGLGLSMPLADFAFTLAGPQPPAIRFLRGGSGEAQQWRFAQFCLCGAYQAAVALRPPGREDLSVRVQERCP